MTPQSHKKFVEHAIPRFELDPRILGVAAQGSWETPEADAYSDLDLIVVSDPGRIRTVLEERDAIAHSLGPCLSAFTGEHVGHPEILICLFDDPLLHVDLKFVSLDDFQTRECNPTVLWERNGALTRVIE